MEVSIETSMNEPPCQGTTPGSSMPNYSKEMELCTIQRKYRCLNLSLKVSHTYFGFLNGGTCFYWILLYKTWLNKPLVINLCLTASMSRCQIKRASQKESFFSLSLSIHNSIFFWLSSFERKLLWEIVGGFNVWFLCI